MYVLSTPRAQTLQFVCCLFFPSLSSFPCLETWETRLRSSTAKILRLSLCFEKKTHNEGASVWIFQFYVNAQKIFEARLFIK